MFAWLKKKLCTHYYQEETHETYFSNGIRLEVILVQCSKCKKRCVYDNRETANKLIKASREFHSGKS